MQISQTRVVDPVIMYRAVGSEIQKERQRENDKGSDGAVRRKDKERKGRGGKQHRDTEYNIGVSLAAVSTPRNANESPHPAKRIKEQQQSLGH